MNDDPRPSIAPTDAKMADAYPQPPLEKPDLPSPSDLAEKSPTRPVSMIELLLRLMAVAIFQLPACMLLGLVCLPIVVVGAGFVPVFDYRPPRWEHLTLFYSLFAGTYAGILRVVIPLVRGDKVVWLEALLGWRYILHVLACWTPALMIQAFAYWIIPTDFQYHHASTTSLVLAIVWIIQSTIGCFFSLAPHLILDRELWIWEAMGESAKLVVPSFMGICAAMLLLVTTLLLIAPLTGGFSLFLIAPLWGILTTIAYLELTGQSAQPIAPVELPDKFDPDGRIAPPPDFDEIKQ